MTIGDKQFYLKTIDVISNEIVFQVNSGEFEKRGRMLNLKETHERVCENQENSDLQYHDAVYDVKVTRRIFEFIIRKLLIDQWRRSKQGNRRTPTRKGRKRKCNTFNVFHS